MTKKSITDLLSTELTDSNDKPTSKKPASHDSRGSDKKERQTNKTRNTKLTESVGLDDTDLDTTELPKYLTLERKEVRLPLEHLDALTMMTRRLNRKRKGKGERITENTLIRVAVSIIVEHKDHIEGSTEDELLKSLENFVAQN